jgi:hypothetical protein
MTRYAYHLRICIGEKKESGILGTGITKNLPEKRSVRSGAENEIHAQR